MKIPSLLTIAAVAVGAALLSGCGEPDKVGSREEPPIDMPPLGRTISAGDGYVLAIDDRGRIFGWGANVHGHVGVVGACAVPVPKLIAGHPTWRSVHAGSRASYAIAVDGALWRRAFPSWASGDCAKGRPLLPYEPLNWDSRWVKVQEAWGIAAGIDSGGALQLWNDGDIKPEAARDVGGRAQATIVDAGPKSRWQDFCLAINKIYAVADDGSLWTDSLDAGPRDRVPLDQFAKLEQVPGDVPLARVFCRTNSSHVLALDARGGLWGMGNNQFGELGDGDGDRFTKSQAVTMLKRLTDQRWRDIAVGSGFTIAIKADGTLWAWGNNARGTLGTGDHDGSDVPRSVDLEKSWTAVAAGYAYALGATTDGAIFSWGDNNKGVLGDGGGSQMHTTPTRVYGQERWAVAPAGEPDAIQ